MLCGSKTLWFATSNTGKFREAEAILSQYRVSIRQLTGPKLELQDIELTRIARFAAERIALRVRGPVIVEDSGLFVDVLRGFPGPFSSYVLNTIGLKGLLALVKGSVNRSARFKASIALASQNAKTIAFTGAIRGTITKTPRGRAGFGFDPIFIPDGARRTFAEMGEYYKNSCSHRALAFSKLGKWCQRKGVGLSTTKEPPQ